MDENHELYEAAKEFFNTTIADTTVTIEASSQASLDNIMRAADRLETILRFLKKGKEQE